MRVFTAIFFFFFCQSYIEFLIRWCISSFKFNFSVVSASLASSLSDDLLTKATVEVVKNLSNKNAKSEITRTNIQMIGALWYFLSILLIGMLFVFNFLPCVTLVL